MHPFAPKKTTSDSGHPGDEELAAYVDGMLVGEEKARVAEHLAECADCYRVYSETLRFQWEEGEEVQEEEAKTAAATAAGTVVPFPADRKVKPVWWLSAAAVVLVGVGAGLFTLFGPAPEMTTAKLVAPLQGEPIPGTDLWTPRTRSGSNEEMKDPAEPLVDPKNSFGIGVQLVNLQVGLERNDQEVADAVLPLLIGLLDEEPLMAPEIRKSFADLGEALHAGSPPQSLIQEASQNSEDLREFLSPDINFELGRFVEAGRLAAITREPSFFDRWSTRRMLHHFLKQQRQGELNLEPEVLKSLEAILERLGKGDLQAADYEALKKNFETILRKQYPPQ